MQWTVQLTALLLNIVWILFFLQPHPFSVSVQRRSTDSSEEFCIQLPSDINWTQTLHSVNVTVNKTNNSNATFQEYGQSNASLHESSNSTNKMFETPDNPPSVQRPPYSPDVKVLVDCCFKFYPGRINKNLISTYFETNYRCPVRAVILVTKKSRHICVDPNLSWVDKIMKSLK